MLSTTKRRSVAPHGVVDRPHLRHHGVVHVQAARGVHDHDVVLVMRAWSTAAVAIATG